MDIGLQQIFMERKQPLTEISIPGFLYVTKEFILVADVSFTTIIAVLSQRDDNGSFRSG